MIQTLELVHVVFECIGVQVIALMISEAMGNVIEHTMCLFKDAQT